MTTFKVMSWNIENLIQPAPNELERLSVFKEKLNLLSRVIRQLNPDVIGFQEVGSESALLLLKQTLKNDYAHHAVSEFPDRRGIRVAFLSKWAIVEREDIAEFPIGPALQIAEFAENQKTTRLVTRMGRGALRIRVQGQSPKLTADVISTHLKSKLLSFSRPDGSTSFQPKNETERVQVAGIAVHKRTAEAVTVRSHINTLLSSPTPTPLILLGDFNDGPETQTSLIFNGPPGSEIGTPGFDRPDQGDKTRLFNLATLIDEPRRFSRIYRGQGELLDQIFASAAFFPLEGKRRRLPQVDSHVDFVEELPSIDENPQNRDRAIAPDHAPVTATFDLR
jgi:endonuclease/exonuclease/phosphatase family metal-dependent hydrolase